MPSSIRTTRLDYAVADDHDCKAAGIYLFFFTEWDAYGDANGEKWRPSERVRTFGKRDQARRLTCAATVPQKLQ